MSYVCPEIVKKSYESLIAKESKGKKHGERTSAMLLFFAFDTLVRQRKEEILSFDAETDEGKLNRRLFEAAYTGFAELTKGQQIIEFGTYASVAKSVPMRIASNFYSVALKKASVMSHKSAYPSRPPTPLLDLGRDIESGKWNVAKHPMWQSNLGNFFLGMKSRTPYTDMALFLLRNTEFNPNESNKVKQMKEALGQIFTQELVEIFGKRLGYENSINQISELKFVSESRKFKYEVESSHDEAYLNQLTKKELIEIILKSKIVVNLGEKNES